MKRTRPQPFTTRNDFFDSTGRLTPYGEATLRQTVDAAVGGLQQASDAQFIALSNRVQDAAQAVASLAHDLVHLRAEVAALRDLASQGHAEGARTQADFQERLAALEGELTTQHTAVWSFEADLNRIEGIALDAQARSMAAEMAARPEVVAEGFREMNVVFNGLGVRGYLCAGSNATVNFTPSTIEMQAYTAATKVIAPDANFFTAGEIE